MPKKSYKWVGKCENVINAAIANGICLGPSPVENSCTPDTLGCSRGFLSRLCHQYAFDPGNDSLYFFIFHKDNPKSSQNNHVRQFDLHRDQINGKYFYLPIENFESQLLSY